MDTEETTKCTTCGNDMAACTCPKAEETPASENAPEAETPATETPAQ